jgi:hypothetical protein
VVVPQVPVGTQAWEISPVAARSLKAERIAGGTRVTIPEFGLTTAILFTTDFGPESLVVRFQEQTRQTRKQAAQWAHDLAEVELDKVTRVAAQLEQAGHSVPDGQRLLENARTRLTTCMDHFNGGNYRDSYDEAQRVLRPLRILMRAQWDEATRDLGSPVASPYAVSYFTLPRHWQFMDRLRQGTTRESVLPGGDFEANPAETVEGWSQQAAILDEVEAEARRVGGEVKEGRQCLKLSIKAKATDGPPPAALERTFLAINSPAVKLAPGTPVRVSAWIQVPSDIAASADGALFYDSAGGEPLALRLTAAMDWKQLSLYRQVPASGEINVTIALTGLGTVYVDDVRIEPILWSGGTTPSAQSAALP